MDYRKQNANTELYESLKALPKIELHRHLEGSLRLGTLAEIAREYKLDLPGYQVEDFRHLVQITPDDPPDANVFLSKFETLRAFYRSPEIIDRVAYEAVADAAAENIVYLELRFTPIALAREMGFPLDEATGWVVAAVKRAQADFGIEVGLIVSMNRNEEVELGEKHAELAAERKGQGIVAVDLAGAEHKFPGAPFAGIFREAREDGLAVTIHAGEWAGAKSVREAIEVLGAERLGHGVRIVEDTNLMQVTSERHIAFEVCLTSNLQSGVVPGLEGHPLRDLYQLGQLTTLNTDDPSVSAINLTDEFVIAVEHLGFSLDDLKQHVMNAAQVAFLPPARKQKLIDRLSAEFYPAGEATRAEG
jgi:adenosine deaminase